MLSLLMIFDHEIGQASDLEAVEQTIELANSLDISEIALDGLERREIEQRLGARRLGLGRRDVFQDHLERRLGSAGVDF